MRLTVINSTIMVKNVLIQPYQNLIYKWSKHKRCHCAGKALGPVNLLIHINKISKGHTTGKLYLFANKLLVEADGWGRDHSQLPTQDFYN